MHHPSTRINLNRRGEIATYGSPLGDIERRATPEVVVLRSDRSVHRLRRRIDDAIGRRQFVLDAGLGSHQRDRLQRFVLASLAQHNVVCAITRGRALGGPSYQFRAESRACS